MRLHQLTVTAFGPFAGSEHVDFDELNDAGLFLLTGATGAGKSTLLDAVCFALYGVVPGVRGTKTLKSQHAPADVAPEVSLDVTLQARRFVVRRSPEWTRPKRRGHGVVVEKAKAAMIETTSGADVLLTARAAEVGVLVRSLMGMTATQFQQVALLPQGEFQTFLRATSQERHDVLEQLFRTDRFSRIEDWVHDHSRELTQRSRGDESTVRRLVHNIADRAGVETPEDLRDEALPRAAADDRVLPWVAGLLADVQAAAIAAESRHQEAVAALEVSRTLFDEACARAERLRRREAAQRVLTDLAEGRSVAAEATAALDAHERAARCTTALDLVRDARSARELAANHLDTTIHGSSLRGLPGRPNESSLTAMLDSARQRGAQLQALLPREAAAAAARASQHRNAQLVREAELRLRASERRTRELPAEVEGVRTELAGASSLAARVEDLAESLAAARRVRRAADELVGVAEQTRRAEEAHLVARHRAQDARAVVLDLTERRLAGVAAELASALQDGLACPVCGGTEHPHPARPAHGAVTAADQERAERALTDRTAELESAEAALRSLQTRRGVLAATAGDLSPEEAAATVADLDSQLLEARAAEERLAPLQARLDELRAEQENVVEERTSAATELAALRQAIASDEVVAAAAEQEVAAALADDVAATVAQAEAAVATVTSELVAAIDAVRKLDEADQQVSRTAERADQTASRHGFTNAAEVSSALLSDHRRSDLASLLRERAEAQAHALATLRETEDGQDEGLGAALPDVLVRRKRERDDAEALASTSASTLAVHQERVGAVGTLGERLRKALDAWAPLRDDALLAESMSRLVRGMGQDNQLQMRLSAYVLATRLDQVVDAANERLAQMRDQRYLLHRTGRAQRRTGQAGLGLEVVDQWTGDVRAPSTLSGGETFVVSLALALGLADVVTHEAAGAEVETLFVDEGFGTLDADTLDDVMDRLDGLRAGGRTVGVVSHVTELRARIPTQVHVDKGRSGSSVTIRTLVG